MKKNHHSLQYKMEANPNKTFKQLKQKQKAKISDWLYKEVFLYYQGHNSFPTDRDYVEIYKRIYDKLCSSAIWCPFDEFERNMLKKKEHMETRVTRDISEGKTEEIFAKKPKKSEKEKLAIKKQQRKDKKKRLSVKKQNESIQLDCDDTFAFIVGYTSGGAPYGTTWEQMGVDPELSYKDKVKSLLEGNFDVE